MNPGVEVESRYTIYYFQGALGPPEIRGRPLDPLGYRMRGVNVNSTPLVFVPACGCIKDLWSMCTICARLVAKSYLADI